MIPSELLLGDEHAGGGPAFAHVAVLGGGRPCIQVP